MNRRALAGIGLAQFGSAAAIRRYQSARLRELVSDAYRTVPFYRRRFDEAGVRPDQIRGLDDLARIPTVTKSDLRQAGDDLLSTACDPARLVRHLTGGSTGEPMVVRMTAADEYLQRFMRLQAMFRIGLRPTDRRVALSFWNHPHQTTLAERAGLMRCRAVSAYQPVDRIIAELRDLKPDVLRGHPSMLSSIADELTTNDRQFIRPRFLMTDSESLTTLTRARIEGAFDAPVHDFYDCWECNTIATQCPDSRLYHVMDHAVIAEVLVDGRPAEPGETGEVVITALHSHAAPFIRYRIGDMAERGPERCSCGAHGSIIRQVHGRAGDMFQLPDGRSIHPNVLVRFVYGLHTAGASRSSRRPSTGSSCACRWRPTERCRRIGRTGCSPTCSRPSAAPSPFAWTWSTRSCLKPTASSGSF